MSLLALIVVFDLGLGLSCPQTKIVMLDGAKWDEAKDRVILNTARRRCGEFYPKSPCVKVFTKLPDRYRVMCGRPE